MRYRMLQRELANTASSNTETLQRLKAAIDKLKAESPAEDGSGKTYRFWATDAVDAGAVTLMEFEQMLRRCLFQLPEYARTVFREGPEAAERKVLFGWDATQLFRQLDADG